MLTSLRVRGVFGHGYAHVNAQREIRRELPGNEEIKWQGSIKVSQKLYVASTPHSSRTASERYLHPPVSAAGTPFRLWGAGYIAKQIVIEIVYEKVIELVREIEKVL